ncbi:thioredoxin-domain-containing protein [Trametopsis cervina]|nr:thioredoxin-domain-containing protein [Trametopsis cervina]
MRLDNILLRLPHTLLLLALSLTATAAPASPESTVELTVLTPDNFQETISTGVWFIEHFSPYCGHCRKFAPTWEQLVEETQKENDPGIHLAQVNCIIHGDLCKANGVDGYPQMNLYKDGKFVETWNKARDFEALKDYLAKRAEPKQQKTVPVEQRVTDGKVEETATPGTIGDKEHNPDGKVIILNEKNFDQTIQDGHVFIKYYAPWCGHCKKLAPVWTQLAADMRGKLNIAEVDCESNSALCHKQGVTGYPMLFYYGQRGHGKTEYTANRKLESLKAFSEKISGPAVQSIKYEAFDTEVAKHPALFLLLHPEGDVLSLNQILKASRALFGTPPVYESTEPAFYERFNVKPGSSVVLSLKDFDRTAPAGVYHLDSTAASSKDAVESLSNWLVRNRLPMSMQLESDTFQDIMSAPHKPLVVITAAPAAKLVGAADRVRTVAAQWKNAKGSDDVVFTWMDSEKWAKWLKSMYGITADDSAHVVIANHSRLIYYDTDPAGERITLSPSSIISALGPALAGAPNYHHSENLVERMARYINDKLVFIEHVVSYHPWGTSLFVVGALAVLFIFLRRVWDQESDYADELARKARLD